MEDELEENFNELNELLAGNLLRNNIVNYYYKGDRKKYLNHLIKSIKILRYADNHKNYIFNVIKTTRAGYTTNAVLAALILGKSVLIVEPTNTIAYDTVKEIMDIYIDVTGDHNKIVRQIPSNKDGCSEVVDKLENSEALELLPFVIGGDCRECGYGVFPGEMFLPKATSERCTIKTMKYEHDALEVVGMNYKPDVMTITYDKLLTLGRSGKRGEFFEKLIRSADIVLFDELGSYLSKCDTGLVIKEEKSGDGFFNVMKLEDKVRDLENFIYGLASNTYVIKFADLLENYVKPWMEGTVRLANGMGEYPRYLRNNLSTELVTISRTSRYGRRTVKTVFKTEALEDHFSMLYDMLEDVLEENEENVIFLLRLIEIMAYRKYVVYETGGLEFNEGREIKVKSINIASTMDELIERLERWISKEQITIFTDATMPTYNFEIIKKMKVSNVFFGDPAKTNSTLLLAHDKNSGIFSVTRWHKNMEYKMSIIEKLINIVDTVGGDNVVVWCPNKRICEELMSVFSEFGYRVCDHNSEEEYSVMFTYYNSILTRGVECDRRLQVLIGKANKPKGSFRHIAFMQRIHWSVFDRKELKKIAEECGMEEDEFKKELERWENIIKHEGEFYMVNEVPEVLDKYFEYYSDAIQMEKTYQDAWQAGSRAKDSLALTRSVLVCLGWRNSDIWELIKWGAADNIKYKISNGELLRVTKGQKAIVSPPNVIKMKYEGIQDYMDNIIDWLNGRPLNNEVVGFDVDLAAGIVNMLMYNDEITSEDVWLTMSKNMNIGCEEEDSKNGYMVGAINAFRLLGGFGPGVECINLGEGNFVFRKNEEIKEEKGTLGFYDMRIMIRLLKNAFLINKDKVGYSDLRNSIRAGGVGGLTNEQIKIGIINIMRLGILKGSTWRVDFRERGRSREYRIIKGIKTDVKNARKRKVWKDYAGAKVKREVLFEILKWYEEDDSLELSPHSLSSYIRDSNVRVIKGVLQEFKERELFEEYGIDCEFLDDLVIMKNYARI